MDAPAISNRSDFSRAKQPRVPGNFCFECDKFPVLLWKNPENSRLELMTYLQGFFVQK